MEVNLKYAKGLREFRIRLNDEKLRVNFIFRSFFNGISLKIKFVRLFTKDRVTLDNKTDRRVRK